MKTLNLTLLLLVTFFNFTVQVPAGIVLTSGIDLLNQFLPALAPEISKALNDIEVEPVSMSGFEIKNIALNITEIDPSQMTLNFSHSDNSILFTLKGIKGLMTGSIEGVGKLTVTIQEGGASVSTKVIMSQQKSDINKQVPAIKLKNFNVVMNQRNIKIKVTGNNFLATIAQNYIASNTKTILDSLTTAIESKVPSILQKNINEALSVSQGALSFAELAGYAFDFSYAALPSVNSNSINFFLNGTFYDEETSDTYPDAKPTNFTNKTVNSSQVAAQISSYTLDSVLQAMYYQDFFRYTLNGTNLTYIVQQYNEISEQDDAENFLVLQLNLLAQLFGTYWPTLESNFGLEVPINFEFFISELPVFTIESPDTIGLTFSIQANLDILDNNQAIAFGIDETYVQFGLDLDNFILKPRIKDIELGTIQLIDTDQGDIDIPFIAQFLDVLGVRNLKQIGGQFMQNYEIPHVFFYGGLEIKNPILNIEDSYIELIVEPTLNF